MGALGACKRGDGTAKAWLELCSGFVAPGGGLLMGRVHAGLPPEAPKPDESTLTRFEESLAALYANPLHDAVLHVTVGPQVFQNIRSNERGYIDLEHLSGFAPPSVHVRLQLDDSRYAADAVEGDFPVYDETSGLAIISDVDDTLLNSEVTSKLKLVKNAALRSAWELEAFPDAALVLTQKARGLPVFYISGSPWGFRQRIGDYFTRSGFPQGQLLLKRFSSDPLFDQMAYKWPYILSVVDALPRKRWLLFGDSGEKDPEIYARLRKERPDRVAAIYIHLVTKEAATSERFLGMTAFHHWKELGSSSE